MFIRKLLSRANNAGCGCGKPKPSDIIQPRPNKSSSESKSKTRKHDDDHHQQHPQKPMISGLDSPSSLGDDEQDNNSSRASFSFNVMDHTSSSTLPSEESMEVLRIFCPCCSSSSSKLCDSVAVSKVSEDPHHDFKQSMMQMIFEKEMESRDDLQALLDCFLQLNPPCHHQTIIRAFMEIWKDIHDSSSSPMNMTRH